VPSCYKLRHREEGVMSETILLSLMYECMRVAKKASGNLLPSADGQSWQLKAHTN